MCSLLEKFAVNANCRGLALKMIFKVEAEEAWDLMTSLANYQIYKDEFSGIDVLQLLREDLSNEEIIDQIISSKLEEIQKK